MIRALATAFSFLTILPSPLSETTDEDLGGAISFFPVVGVALGLGAAGVGYAVMSSGSSLMSAVAVVTWLAATTRGLHLDGVSDLFDGLGGGRGERERTLTIMRDSRIGAHGATALILLLMAKAAALAALLDARTFWPLLGAPVVARWAVTPLLVFFPYARVEGLGRGFTSQAGVRHVMIATVMLGAALAALVVAAAVGTVGGAGVGAIGWGTAKQASAALMMSLALGWWLRARLGGLTGDVYGAAIEIGETVALMVAAWR